MEASAVLGLIAESLDLARQGERLARPSALLRRFDPGDCLRAGHGCDPTGSKVGHVIIWADGTVTALRGSVEGSRRADRGAA